MDQSATPAGTQGYQRDVARFLERSWQLHFREVCEPVLPYLPDHGAQVLDVGAGAGQNAAALCALGYQVTACEPLPDFRGAAEAKYAHMDIEWLAGALPDLEALGERTFAFILVEAVWHHLDPEEQATALRRLAELLEPNGKLSLSLRNGPAGMGTRVFPTDAAAVASMAEDRGLECLFRQDDIPSFLPGKAQVRWSRLVLSRSTVS